MLRCLCGGDLSSCWSPQLGEFAECGRCHATIGLPATVLVVDAQGRLCAQLPPTPAPPELAS